MIFNLYADFDPDDNGIPGDYTEFTENDLCWPTDVCVPAESFYRYSSTESWNFTSTEIVIPLCCSGDYLEFVEPGPRRSVTVIV